MSWTLYGLLVAVSFGALFPVTMLLRRMAVIDMPNTRSSHTRPIVRGGGVVMVLLIMGVLFVETGAGLRGIIAPLLALAGVSFWDDLRSVPAGWRIGVQTGVALLVLSALPLIGGVVGVISAAVLLVWIVGYTNAFNFMDGINGLAAGQAVLTGLGTAWLAFAAGLSTGHPAVILGLAVSAVAAGFLPHNFPRPRVFMGDVGSASLGCLLAVAAAFIVRDGGGWCALYLGALHANFVLDTGVTLLRRAARGERWYVGHREHFYQRLIRVGWSHARVTGCELGLQTASVLALGVTAQTGVATKLLVAAAIVAGWGIFFAVAEWKFSRSLAATASVPQ